MSSRNTGSKDAIWDSMGDRLGDDQADVRLLHGGVNSVRFSTRVSRESQSRSANGTLVHGRNRRARLESRA